jgi:5'-methylthioadenosine phosphorylase
MILGVLGGSGLYDLDGLTDVREHAVTTPFGEPSAPVVAGRLGEAHLLFLPRHGRGHRFLPSEINYRANVHALRQLGAERVLSISAVGSLKEGIAPGDVIVVDQFIDRTYRRATSFFGDGVVGHVSFAHPVCDALAGVVTVAAGAAGFANVHRGGTYVCMEGPQFSTRAESILHGAWGAHAIGMTAATEAKLCREAELCFAALALVTDYDAWHSG